MKWRPACTIASLINGIPVGSALVIGKYKGEEATSWTSAIIITITILIICDIISTSIKAMSDILLNKHSKGRL